MTLDRRRAVVAEAETWLGTPFHHAARVKGAGVDCLMILAEVYERAGVIEHAEAPFYVPDWFLHRDEEKYLAGVMNYAAEVAGPPERLPLPGDFIVMKMGRTFSHGAIVTDWPHLIHAYYAASKVVRGDATQTPFAGRPLKFFDPFGER